MAMAVPPFFAQEGEPSETEEEKQTDQVFEETAGDEAEPEMDDESMQWDSESGEVESEPGEVESAQAEPEPGQVESEPGEWEGETGGGRHYRQPREVQTLMSGSGGYGALSVGYTEVNDQPSLLMGARAEWVLGHGFGIGIAGVAFASDHEVDGEYSYGLAGGYGGLVLEPIILGWFPVHIALPVLIGAGGISNYSVNTDYWYNEDYEPEFRTYAGFFVAEFGAELEFNLVRAVRLSIFGNYRWTPDLNMRGYYGITEPYPEDSNYRVSSHALNSWSAGVRFKFGSF